MVAELFSDNIARLILLILLGAIIGILYGIRKIYVVEEKIEKMEEHIEMILTHVKKKK